MMGDENEPREGGGRPDGTKAEARFRHEREAAALRINLQRRKQQARKRRDRHETGRPEDDSTGA